jgi:hypothetical protein
VFFARLQVSCDMAVVRFPVRRRHEAS